MRILYLCADLGIPVLGEKGAAVHVRAMTTALAAAGHQVSLVAAATTKSPWRPPATLPPAVDVRHVPASRDMAWASSNIRAFADSIAAPRGAAGEVRRVLYNQELLAALDRSFGDEPPDVVYERASLLCTAGLAFARQVGVPHLLELNAPLAGEHRRFRQGGALHELAEAAERWLLQGSDAVLTVSAPLLEHVVARGLDRRRGYVVPNGIDPDVFSPGPADAQRRGRLGAGAGPVLGFVGGLRPWHGVEDIPALVDALRGEFPTLRAVVVGHGPLRPRLEQQISQLALGAHVHLVGGVPHQEVPDWIRSFDIALAPYPEVSDDFYFSPLKLFEYMACGVPVVAPALGQLRDVLADGRHGVLYEAGRFDALVDACRRLLHAPDERRRLGAAARTRVATAYTWAGNAARVVDIVETVRRRPVEVQA